MRDYEAEFKAFVGERDEIPADIWEAAFDAIESAENYVVESVAQAFIDATAAAIYAERKRCKGEAQ